jgi:hypothetical protein
VRNDSSEVVKQRDHFQERTRFLQMMWIALVANTSGKSVSTARGLSKGGDGLQAKSTSQSRDARVREAGKKAKEAGVVGLIREDISMIIRRRAKAGYGLSQVNNSIK